MRPATLVYSFETNGIDEGSPLIYCWEIDDGGGEIEYRYVGKSINGSHRPRTAYRLNVNRLLAGKPYRKGKPDGFRVVHRRLADATKNGHSITLRLLSNVAGGEDIFEQERYWQRILEVEPTEGDIDADSIEQRIAEALIRSRMEARIGAALPPSAASGMQFDGLSRDPPVLVEIWAHQGAPKPAQKNKVMTDALKLLHGDEHLFDGRGRKILAMADDEAAAPFRQGTWMASALKSFDVDVVVVDLPVQVKARLRAAQQRQARGNR